MICTNLPVQAAGALDLYAVWKVRVTLDAGEGVFTGGATEEEKALAASGVSTGSFEVNTQSRYSTGLSAKRDGYGFVEWNTEPDGSGTELSEYGLITGPVTFYAVYYQTDFPCIQDVQVFKAPRTATYRIQCWGASGGMDQRSVGNVYGGSGGYCAGLLALNEGDVLYVYTGGAGGDETGVGNPVMWGGYNGGGSGPLSGGSSGGGGGATDVRLVGGSWDNPEGLASRLIVAAGGGKDEPCDWSCFKQDGTGLRSILSLFVGSAQNRKNDRCEDDSGECHNRFSFRHFGHPLSLFLCL